MCIQECHLVQPILRSDSCHCKLSQCPKISGSNGWYMNDNNLWYVHHSWYNIYEQKHAWIWPISRMHGDNKYSNICAIHSSVYYQKHIKHWNLWYPLCILHVATLLTTYSWLRIAIDINPMEHEHKSNGTSFLSRHQPDGTAYFLTSSNRPKIYYLSCKLHFVHKSVVLNGNNKLIYCKNNHYFQHIT